MPDVFPKRPLLQRGEEILEPLLDRLAHAAQQRVLVLVTRARAPGLIPAPVDEPRFESLAGVDVRGAAGVRGAVSGRRRFTSEGNAVTRLLMAVAW